LWRVSFAFAAVSEEKLGYAFGKTPFSLALVAKGLHVDL
jgi:hypothetical protein